MDTFLVIVTHRVSGWEESVGSVLGLVPARLLLSVCVHTSPSVTVPLRRPVLIFTCNSIHAFN